MNRLIVFVIALSFVFSAVVQQSLADDTSDEDASSETVTETDDTSDSSENSAVSTGEAISSTANDVAKAQEEQLTEAMGDMTEYFSKSITDMSNILEDIKNVGEDNSETVRNNLVDNLMSYVDDTDMMKQLIGRVLALRSQFQESLLKQLYSLPINAEDAEKLENDLREQIKLRGDRIPDIQNIMDFSQYAQMPQQIPQMAQQIPQMAQQIPQMAQQIPQMAQQIPQMAQQMPERFQKQASNFMTSN